MIIGISGKIGSGKSLIARNIEIKYGFRRLSSSDLLKKILESKGLDHGRENLQELGDALIKTVGGSGFMALMLAYLPEGNYIIDSIRHLDALQYMKKTYTTNFVSLFVDATNDVRYLRRKDQFKSRDHFEIIDNASTEIEIESIQPLSDYIIINNGAFLSELESQIEQVCTFSIFNSNAKERDSPAKN
jgi:dephospho-CoA kinase